MAGDWVKLHRALLDNEMITDPWLLQLWIWCLLKANYTESKGLSAGQFVTGKLRAAEELRISPSRWFRGVEKLVELGCITKTVNRSWTTITLCNWSTYQNDTDNSGLHLDRNWSTVGPELDTVRKKGRREEGKKNASAFTPPTISEVAEYCLVRGNQIDPEHFHAHYTANGWMQGGKAKMKNWKAAIVTWEKRDKQTKPKGPKTVPFGSPDNYDPIKGTP